MAADPKLVENNEKFTEVLKKKRTKKESGVFHLINCLIRDNDALIRNLNIRTASSAAEREAHYISFDCRTVSQPLYSAPQYRLCERHLTLDRYFWLESSQRGLSGFSYAHYKEVYEILPDANAQDVGKRKFITVRAYFNMQGQPINAWVTEPKTATIVDDAETKHDEEMNEMPDEEQQVEAGYQRRLASPIENDRLRKNGAVVEEMMRAFLDIKARLAKTALDSYSLHENELDKLEAAGLKTVDAIKSYIRKANVCLKALKIINAYNDLETRSGASLERRIAILNSKLKALKKAAASPPQTAPAESNEDTKADDEVETLARLSATPETEPAKAIIAQDASEKLYQAILSAEKTVDVLLKQDEPQALFEAYQVALTLKENIFSFRLAHNFDCPQGKEKRIEQIENTLKNKKLDPLKLFESFLMAGDVSAFKALFDIAKEKLHILWFFEPMKKIIIQDNKGILGNHLAIFKFLYENSAAYRYYMFPFSAKCFEANVAELKYSILYLAAHHNNVEVYSLLLDQGYDSNGHGLLYDGRAVSNLHALTMNTDAVYTRLLIAKGAIINRPSEGVVTEKAEINALPLPKIIRSLATDEKSIAHVKTLKTSGRARNEKAGAGFQMMLDEKSDLLMACYFHNHEVAKFLVEKSDLQDVVRAFSYMINEKSTIWTLLPVALSGGVAFAHNESEKQQLRLDAGWRSSGSLYVLPESYRIKFIFLDRLSGVTPTFAIAEMLYSILHQKCLHDSETIDKTIGEIKENLKHKANAGSLEKIADYCAIRFLIAEKEILSIHDVVQLMYCTGHVGILSNDLDQTGSGGIVHFLNVINIAKMSSRYFPKLLEDENFIKQYCFAEKKLKGSLYEVKPQDRLKLQQTSKQGGVGQIAGPLRFSQPESPAAALPATSEPKSKPAAKGSAAKVSASASAASSASSTTLLPQGPSKKGKKKKK